MLDDLCENSISYIRRLRAFLLVSAFGVCIFQGVRMKIQIYDTTLRDGTQGESVSFSMQDKLRVAHKLDEFGVDYIEGGWPGSNEKDMDFFSMRPATRRGR